MPQLEKKTINILAALAQLRLPGEAVQIFHLLLCASTCNQQQKVEISITDIGAVTGMPRSSVSRAIRTLLARNMIKKGGYNIVTSKHITYGINYKTDTWRVATILSPLATLLSHFGTLLSPLSQNGTHLGAKSEGDTLYYKKKKKKNIKKGENKTQSLSQEAKFEPEYIKQTEIELKFIKITQEELLTLKKFCRSDAMAMHYLKSLGNYITKPANRNKYDSHYLTARNWYRIAKDENKLPKGLLKQKNKHQGIQDFLDRED